MISEIPKKYTVSEYLFSMRKHTIFNRAIKTIESPMGKICIILIVGLGNKN